MSELPVGETVRVEQGSQPHFAGVRVGVVRVGEHHGLRKARLWVNGTDDREHLRVDLAEGESQDLFGRGTLTLDAVHLTSRRRGDVTLTFRAAHA